MLNFGCQKLKALETKSRFCDQKHKTFRFSFQKPKTLKTTLKFCCQNPKTMERKFKFCSQIPKAM